MSDYLKITVRELNILSLDSLTEAKRLADFLGEKFFEELYVQIDLDVRGCFPAYSTAHIYVNPILHYLTKSHSTKTRRFQIITSVSFFKTNVAFGEFFRLSTFGTEIVNRNNTEEEILEFSKKYNVLFKIKVESEFDPTKSREFTIGSL